MARSSSRRASRSANAVIDGSDISPPLANRRHVLYAAMEFAERYGPWAVVAGASDGVGASVARLLGARGVNVVLVARRQAALDEVAATVDSETRPVALDLSAADADAALAAATDDIDVGLLIYIAGGEIGRAHV